MIDDLVHCPYPIVYKADVSLGLLLCKTYITAVWLDQDVVFLLLFAEDFDSCLRDLMYFRAWSNLNGALEIPHIFEVFDFSVAIKFEKPELLITIPVLLAQLAFHYHIILLQEGVVKHACHVVETWSWLK